MKGARKVLSTRSERGASENEKNENSGWLKKNLAGSNFLRVSECARVDKSVRKLPSVHEIHREPMRVDENARKSPSVHECRRELTRVDESARKSPNVLESRREFKLLSRSRMARAWRSYIKDGESWKKSLAILSLRLSILIFHSRNYPCSLSI